MGMGKCVTVYRKPELYPPDRARSAASEHVSKSTAGLKRVRHIRTLIMPNR
jgi:hypothetical protein